jgi:hypothetical protein
VVDATDPHETEGPQRRLFVSELSAAQLDAKLKREWGRNLGVAYQGSKRFVPYFAWLRDQGVRFFRTPGSIPANNQFTDDFQYHLWEGGDLRHSTSIIRIRY